MYVISFIERDFEFFNITNVFFTDNEEEAKEATNSLNISLRFLQNQWQNKKLGCISIPEWKIFIVSPKNHLCFEYKKIEQIEHTNIVNVPLTYHIHLFSKEKDEFVNPLLVNPLQ